MDANPQTRGDTYRYDYANRYLRALRRPAACPRLSPGLRDSNAPTHAYPKPDSYPYSHTDPDSYPYSHTDPDSYPYSHTHADPDTHTHTHSHSHAHSYSHSYRDGYIGCCGTDRRVPGGQDRTVQD